MVLGGGTDILGRLLQGASYIHERLGVQLLHPSNHMGARVREDALNRVRLVSEEQEIQLGRQTALGVNTSAEGDLGANGELGGLFDSHKPVGLNGGRQVLGFGDHSVAGEHLGILLGSGALVLLAPSVLLLLYVSRMALFLLLLLQALQLVAVGSLALLLDSILLLLAAGLELGFELECQAREGMGPWRALFYCHCKRRWRKKRLSEKKTISLFSEEMAIAWGTSDHCCSTEQ